MILERKETSTKRSTRSSKRSLSLKRRIFKRNLRKLRKSFSEKKLWERNWLNLKLMLKSKTLTTKKSSENWESLLNKIRRRVSLRKTKRKTSKEAQGTKTREEFFKKAILLQVRVQIKEAHQSTSILKIPNLQISLWMEEKVQALFPL